MEDQITAIIKDCWNRGLTEDDCFEMLKKYSLLTGKWKMVRMICEVYDKRNEQLKKDLEEIENLLLEQQL